MLGGTFTLAVNDPTHNFAAIFGYAQPSQRTIPNGTVLVNGNSAFYFRVNMLLPSGSLDINMPNVPALCGKTAYTQAILIGGGNPWRLSNAVDLTSGL